MFPRHLNEAGDVLSGHLPFAAFPGMEDAAHDHVQGFLWTPQKIVKLRYFDGQIVALIHTGLVLLQESQPFRRGLADLDVELIQLKEDSRV